MLYLYMKLSRIRKNVIIHVKKVKCCKEWEGIVYRNCAKREGCERKEGRPSERVRDSITHHP